MINFLILAIIFDTEVLFCIVCTKRKNKGADAAAVDAAEVVPDVEVCMIKSNQSI